MKTDTRLEQVGLSLAGSPALPDVILLDAKARRLWLIEVVATGGEITEARRAALLKWAAQRGVEADGCSFLTVYRSRSTPVARRTIGRLAWGTDVWFADEPDHIMRLE